MRAADPRDNRNGPYFMSRNDESAKQVSLPALFLVFLKLGLFTIGGGMAMVPQMQQLFAEEYKMLSQEEVIDCIAVSQSLPGVLAINMATFIGRRVRGVRGAVCAAVGVVIPSFVIICLAVLVLDQIGEMKAVQGAFTGVKAAVCGLILVTAFRLGKQILKSPFEWVMMAAALLAAGVFGVNVVWVILGAAVLGIIYTVIAGERRSGGKGASK